MIAYFEILRHLPGLKKLAGPLMQDINNRWTGFVVDLRCYPAKIDIVGLQDEMDERSHIGRAIRRVHGTCIEERVRTGRASYCVIVKVDDGARKTCTSIVRVVIPDRAERAPIRCTPLFRPEALHVQSNAGLESCTDVVDKVIISYFRAGLDGTLDTEDTSMRDIVDESVWLTWGSGM